MTLLDNLAARFGYTKAQSAAPSWALQSAERAHWDMPDLYYVSNQEDLYRKLSWVQIAVHLIASTCAGANLQVMKRVGEDKKPVGNHPLELLFQSPNELDSDHDEFFEAAFAYYQLTGNCYWWVNAQSPTSPPDELWIVPSEKIQPVPDGRLYISKYRYVDGEVQIDIPVTDIVHFKSFNPLNRFVGLSPIGAVANTAGGDMAMSEWNANYFGKNNAKPEGVLRFTTKPQDYDRMKEELRANHGGTARNLLTMAPMPKDGIEWLQMGIPHKDIEFLQGRQFNREEIFQLYGVPMGIMSENATEANSTVAKATFNENTCWPLLTRFAGKVTSKLLPRYGQGLVAEYDDIRVTDRQIELEERKTWSMYRTIDELRSEDDLESIDDIRKKNDQEPIGSLLVAEITKVTERIAGSPGQPIPQPQDQQLGQPVKPPDNAPPTPAEAGIPNANNAEPPTPMKAAPAYTADLWLWRKKAVRMFALKGTGVCGFNSDMIPGDVRNRVAYGLAGAGDVGAVKAVFDGEIKAVEGEQRAEIIELASAIRRAAATVGTEL
jgi:HK97 family phage portal protein